MPKLVDSPDDILALFGGTVIVIVLSVVTFLNVNGLAEQALIALIAIGTLIFNHFFQKRRNDASNGR